VKNVQDELGLIN